MAGKYFTAKSNCKTPSVETLLLSFFSSSCLLPPLQTDRQSPPPLKTGKKKKTTRKQAMKWEGFSIWVRRLHPESGGSESCRSHTHRLISSLTPLRKSPRAAVPSQLSCWWDWLTRWGSGGLVTSPGCSRSTGGLINGGSHGSVQLDRKICTCCWCWRAGCLTFTMDVHKYNTKTDTDGWHGRS